MTKAEILLEAVNNHEKLPANVRKKINSELYAISTKYYTKIPLNDINGVLSKHGIILLQEDNTKWSGMLLGDDSKTTINIGYTASKNGNNMYVPIGNSVLFLSWHRMPSKRYEINLYLS